MSDITVTMSEECYEARLSVQYAVGQAAAHEDLAAYFRKRSGELFAAGNESLARYLRNVVVPEMESRAKHWRAQQNKLGTAADAMEAGS